MATKKKVTKREAIQALVVGEEKPVQTIIRVDVSKEDVLDAIMEREETRLLDEKEALVKKQAEILSQHLAAKKELDAWMLETAKQRYKLVITEVEKATGHKLKSKLESKNGISKFVVNKATLDVVASTETAGDHDYPEEWRPSMQDPESTIDIEMITGVLFFAGKNSYGEASVRIPYRFDKNTLATLPIFKTYAESSIAAQEARSRIVSVDEEIHKLPRKRKRAKTSMIQSFLENNPDGASMLGSMLKAAQLITTKLPVAGQTK